MSRVGASLSVVARDQPLVLQRTQRHLPRVRLLDETLSQEAVGIFIRRIVLEALPAERVDPRERAFERALPRRREAVVVIAGRIDARPHPLQEDDELPPLRLELAEERQ